jgi:GT2 family glycosyltransferase/2-polyprenyl-3-methyl-5-hydroxy-6-metoxy-1,4-benzoquinol methylase/glycosyltransferase involved in cell wall biosynthesis
MHDPIAASSARQAWAHFFRGGWEAAKAEEEARTRMSLLLSGLPEPELAFLLTAGVQVADSGCGRGDGTALLSQQLPACAVVGVGFSQELVEEARRRYPSLKFVFAEPEGVPPVFDVVICCDCLQHFPDPLALMALQIRCATSLYIALVPYEEAGNLPAGRQPLPQGLPEAIEGFRKLDSRLILGDAGSAPTHQLLIYGSPGYLAGRVLRATSHSEKAKWERHFGSVNVEEEDEATRRFNDDLADTIAELLPEGGRVLDAGCGGGWQTLALARLGKFEIAAMDFSATALASVERLLARHGLGAHVFYGDLFEPGTPEFDLVFNVGVAEHYAFDDQVALLRGMASRSRRYLLVLVPNPACYWYWLWRIQSAAKGAWPWGKEVPVLNMASAFEAAGIRFLGLRYFGATWTRAFIQGLEGIDPVVRAHILQVHESPLIPESQKSYLIGNLGAVSPREDFRPRYWHLSSLADRSEAAQLAASLADSLALQIAAEREISSLRAQSSEKEAQLAQTLRLLEAAQAENVRVRADLAQSQTAIAEQIQKLETRRQGLEADKERLRRQIQALEAHSKSMEAERDAASREARATAEELRGQFEQAQQQWQSEQQILSQRLQALEVSLSRSEARERHSAEESRQAREEALRLRRENELLSGQKQEAEAQAARLSSLISELQEQIRQRSDVLEALTASFDQLRQRMVCGLRQFEERHHQQHEHYRRQRAYQVMLLIWKAYQLLLRRGWRGRVEFLRWLPGLLTRRGLGLGAFDLRFPNVWSFLPDELHTPIVKPDLAPLPVSLPKAPGDERSSAHSWGGQDRPRELDLMSADPKSQPKYDVIVLPVFDFEFRYQRPQQIAAGFARAGHRVYWVSPTRCLDPGSGQAYQLLPLRDRLWEVRLPGRPFDMYSGFLEPSVAQVFVDSLCRLYQDLALAESCVLIQFPVWRQVGLGLKAAFGLPVVYDRMDNWSGWRTEPRISEFNLHEEQRLVRECDVLTVTAGDFHRLYSNQGLHPVRVRNAADFDFFHAASPHPALAGLPKPIIGYYGVVADWFDCELLTEVARLRPAYSFVVVGQLHGNAGARFAKLPNLHLPGEKGYAEIPAFLASFDVCLIPFLVDELTNTVDPVKLYEYFSQGKPVVATPMTEVAPHARLLYLARDVREFASQIDLALHEPPDAPVRTARVEFARGNTWNHRVRAFDIAVRERFPLVSVLIVTFHSREFLRPFFESISRHTAYPRYELVCVDNASRDGTASVLRGYAGRDTRIKVICADANLGFAAGNNLAARHAGGEYLVLLNPDTIVTRGWLERLLRPMRRDPGVGLVGPVTNFSGNETKVNVDYHNLAEMEGFAERVARGNYGRVMEVEVLPLFCAMTSAKIWEEVGGLDERFEVGMFEDDDLCHRVRQAGYRIVVAEDTFIHHFGNGSFAQLAPDFIQTLFDKNRQRFEAKWNTRWARHRTRPGVQPPSEEARFTVDQFVRPAERGGERGAPEVSRREQETLLPAACSATRLPGRPEGQEHA